jgi:DNA ligase 1
MQTPADVILALEANSSRNKKEEIITDAWNMGIVEFFEGAQMAYDALRTFGIKKVPLIEGDDDPNFQSAFDWTRFKKIANELETRKLTGNMARDTLRSAADVANIKEWNGFYRRVLLKDLKCGITESTINKVLKAVKDPAAAQYIIPVFSCQLAKNGEDHPKKLKGAKLLDPKLDGVRIVTILDKEKNTVTQYSRDGRLNENFPQISAALSNLLPHITESIMLDGEMVSRSFQALMKQLNRKEDVDTSDAKLALFDCVPLKDFLAGECMMTQTERHEALVLFQPHFDTIAAGNIYVIPKLAVDLDSEEGQTTFKEFNRETVDAGFEGIMVKDPDATYRTKRTDAWLKIKPFITIDLEVVAVEPGTPGTKYQYTTGALLCRGVDQGRNIEVSVGSGFSEELREQMWANKDSVINRIVEIKGDVLTKSQDSDIWSLRFPTFLQFRGWNPGEKI